METLLLAFFLTYPLFLMRTGSLHAATLLTAPPVRESGHHQNPKEVTEDKC